MFIMRPLCLFALLASILLAAELPAADAQAPTVTAKPKIIEKRDAQGNVIERDATQFFALVSYNEGIEV